MPAVQSREYVHTQGSPWLWPLPACCGHTPVVSPALSHRLPILFPHWLFLYSLKNTTIQRYSLTKFSLYFSHERENISCCFINVPVFPNDNHHYSHPLFGRSPYVYSGKLIVYPPVSKSTPKLNPQMTFKK